MLYSCLIYFFTIAICVRATQQIRTAIYRHVLAKRNNNCIKLKPVIVKQHIINNNQTLNPIARVTATSLSALRSHTAT